MRMRNLEMLVGLFILAGFAALLLLALRVSGLSLTGEKDTYRIYAHFDNIAGLTAKARVSMAGVIIGKVSHIELDHNTFTGKVTMLIDKSINDLPADSSASILTAGLLGEKYIGITVGGDDAVLKDGDSIHDTQSALVLEEMIGKFLMNNVNNTAVKE